MRGVPRSVWRGASSAVAAALIAGAALSLTLSDASAQRPLVDPRGISLKTADLPRGFAVVERETAFEPLRTGQSDADIVGVSFKTTLERPRTLENLQSGPVRVAQVIARSDDPERATFSLDAQREFNVQQQGYEVAECAAPADELLCLIRRDGPFVEYRIAAVKNQDTLVSTTATGLSSAVHLEGTVALAQVSLGRYDEQLTEVIAALPPTSIEANAVDGNVRRVVTPTPTSAPLPPPPPPAASATATAPTSQSAQSARSGPKSKLPDGFDERLAQPWAELMQSSATTKSGDKLVNVLQKIVSETDLEVSVGPLRPNVGGELRAIANLDGDKAKIIESSITINKDVMNESPRVLAAMLAHEIVHAGQSLQADGGKLPDCVEAEVEAYGVQARVWNSFWSQGQRPTGTKWERSMNYVEEVWRDSGDAGLRALIREEIADAHSCID